MTDDIQLPEGGFVKVVQLLIKGKPVLRVRDSHSWHSDILKDALQEFGLNYQMMEIPGNIMGNRIPHPSGEDYQVIGMGYCLRSGNMLRFNGDSRDYKIGIDREHLEKCKPLFPEGIEFKVT